MDGRSRSRCRPKQVLADECDFHHLGRLGGWYDHVPPPLKDTWKGGGPAHGPSYTGTQFSYGPRVGCLVLSPFSKRGISKVFHSHVSVVSFCQKTFGLPAINARAAASDDMSDCFDFAQPPLPPPVLGGAGSHARHGT